MGLFEFIGEAMNPGSVGRIQSNKGINKNVNIRTLVLKSIISVGIIVGLYFLIFGRSFHLKGLLIYLGIMIVYCLIGFYIVPKPDYSNIGWLGGLIDHPFRYSDDLNRMLIFLVIVLYPGRLISTTVATWIWLNSKAY